jgi:hypothetical protein
MMKSWLGFVGLLLVFITVSCQEDRLKVNIDNVEVSIEFTEMDKGFSEVKKDGVAELNRLYRMKLGSMYDFYLMSILKAGYSSDAGMDERLWEFAKDDHIKRIHQEMLGGSTDRIEVNSELVNMFKHLKYHLPEAKLPIHIVYWNSLFTNSAVSSDSVIGVGVERYLGTSKYYDSLPSPPHYVYIKEKYKPQYMKSDIAKSWLGENVVKKHQSETFLDELIYQGIIMYSVDAMLPDETGANKMRYSEKDYEWALDKERITWEFMVKQNLIYSTDPTLIRDYFNVAPFTQGLPEKAPGQIGIFIGWRIVKSYMDKYPEVSLEDLLAEKDYQKILKGYKINE